MNKKIRNIPQRNLLLILSVAVGLLCGFSAVLLKEVVALIQSGWSSLYSSGTFRWGYLVCPGLGMLISLIIVKYVVHDDISHGVTKVLLAISKNESNIKSHNMWSSLVTSAVTIGFGGSVGAEAPIVYTGASIGSNVGRAAGLSYKDTTVLLGCGAAAAIAGIFKAPLAGVLFTFEILLFNISMSSMLPMLISSITSTVVTYLFMGHSVQFPNVIETFRIANLPYYLMLGLFCGLMSFYFIRATLRAEDVLRKVRSPWVKWAVCSLLLGLMIFIFPPLYGEGYEALVEMLNNNAQTVLGGVFGIDFLNRKWVFLLFFAMIMLLKVLATAFTNAGGGVGGTFGPTLVTGGLAGFVVARLINLSGIALVPETNFVLVGMAGLMAGVMQAPMTAIFLIAEITGGYDLFIPLITTAVVSFATVHTVEPYSIYSKRIAAAGDLLTHDSDSTVLTLLKTSDLIETDFHSVSEEDTLGTLVKVIAASKRNIFPVLDSEGHFNGIVTLDSVRELMFDSSMYDVLKIKNIMRSIPAFVYADERMQSVMEKFEATGTWSLPVLDDENKYLGFVSKSRIFTSYREQLQQVSHE